MNGSRQTSVWTDQRKSGDFRYQSLPSPHIATGNSFMVLATACPLPRVRMSIENLLKENIDRRTAHRLHDVEVHLNDDEVIINGEAHSYYDRQLALTTVLHALTNWGPVRIVDNIRVKSV